ncbi:hypothetical protein PPERSA_03407 [Pseudocohnilembus persalinus]|uniref:Uncharacterized protein n=1 Tax=Pseudocohnilembus persalinus TaxID=266149 RepID=A0A0V0QBJ8_PSEPJ|nr:hypothetical protein PPERSA_03407 [Pseudocohnilembus persalinus]|eukprot:KRW99606.1 hypothetical protein PPERSA_03407 [Pseudocohnilembus persalinus]
MNSIENIGDIIQNGEKIKNYYQQKGDKTILKLRLFKPGDQTKFQLEDLFNIEKRTRGVIQIEENKKKEVYHQIKNQSQKYDKQFQVKNQNFFSKSQRHRQLSQSKNNMLQSQKKLEAYSNYQQLNIDQQNQQKQQYQQNQQNIQNSNIMKDPQDTQNINQNQNQEQQKLLSSAISDQNLSFYNRIITENDLRSERSVFQQNNHLNLQTYIQEKFPEYNFNDKSQNFYDIVTQYDQEQSFYYTKSNEMQSVAQFMFKLNSLIASKQFEGKLAEKQIKKGKIQIIYNELKRRSIKAAQLQCLEEIKKQFRKEKIFNYDEDMLLKEIEKMDFKYEKNLKMTSREADRQLISFTKSGDAQERKKQKIIQFEFNKAYNKLTQPQFLQNYYANKHKMSAQSIKNDFNKSDDKNTEQMQFQYIGKDLPNNSTIFKSDQNQSYNKKDNKCNIKMNKQPKFEFKNLASLNIDVQLSYRNQNIKQENKQEKKFQNEINQQNDNHQQNQQQVTNNINKNQLSPKYTQQVQLLPKKISQKSIYSKSQTNNNNNNSNTQQSTQIYDSLNNISNKEPKNQPTEDIFSELNSQLNIINENDMDNSIQFQQKKVLQARPKSANKVGFQNKKFISPFIRPVSSKVYNSKIQ